MIRVIRFLARLLPADVRNRHRDEIVADLELTRLEHGRLPAREVAGIVAESLRLHAVGKTLAGSITTSLTWSLGLLAGVACAQMRQGTNNGALVAAITLAVMMTFSVWRTRTFLWVTAVFGAVAVGVAVALFVTRSETETRWTESFFHPGFVATGLIVLIGSLALRRSPADLKPPKWSLLAVPCGVGISLLQAGGSLYALTVLIALILSYWNPHPAIVLTSVPWLVGVGPMAVVEMFTHRSTGATTANLLGMLALAVVAIGWVLGNHQRHVRRSLKV